jgi:protein-S-isoprenylcysteine O-methyltransferase Ste14
VAIDQPVISTGPYAMVRHPLYAGALGLLFGTPLALGSWWALLLMLPMTLVIAEYCQRVRYRLIPSIW